MALFSYMPTKPSKSNRFANTASRLLYGIAGWIAVGLGVLGLLVTFLQILGGSAPINPVLSTMVTLISVAFVLFGLFVNPRFRRRLDRRRSLTRFGRIQSVDERALHSEEGQTAHCVSCGSQLNEGLIRRYREEVFIAGIPAFTRSEDYNYYCAECAESEFGNEAQPEYTPAESDKGSKKQTQSATERY